MPNLIVLVGPPGSGKSTLARKLIFAQEVSSTYINQDTQGKDHLNVFNSAILSQMDIIVDRMGFNKQQRARYLEPAKKAGYKTKIIVLHESRETCLKRCEARKDHPTVKTEEDRNNAINMFFSKYERPSLDEADEVEFRYPEGNKKECCIFDLDGTLCNIDHRLHYMKAGPKKNWAGFFADMHLDGVNQWCKSIITNFFGNRSIVLCSGRPDSYRKVTKEWLEKNRIFHDELFMRPRNDSRDDSLVKEILLDFEILTRYKPLFAVDDRLRVTKMWRSRDIVCLQCHEGDF